MTILTCYINLDCSAYADLFRILNCLIVLCLFTFILHITGSRILPSSCENDLSVAWNWLKHKDFFYVYFKLCDYKAICTLPGWWWSYQSAFVNCNVRVCYFFLNPDLHCRLVRFNSCYIWFNRKPQLNFVGAFSQLTVHLLLLFFKCYQVLFSTVRFHVPKRTSGKSFLLIAESSFLHAVC